MENYFLKGTDNKTYLVPQITKVSDLTNDAGYLTQHQDISGKLDASKLPEAIDDALAQAKASGEFDGADGKPGLVWKGEWDINVSYEKDQVVFYKGSSYVHAPLQADIPAGISPEEDEGWQLLAERGAQGVTWKGQWSINQSYVKNDVVTYNGSAYICVVNNVNAASSSPNNTSDWALFAEKGADGYTPVKDKDYFDGKDGTSVTVKSVSESTADGGSNVVTFSDGKTLTVKNGKTGAAGLTPVRGVDYWIPDDQEAIVQQVLTVMGMHIVGVVDGNNNIVLTGHLADGVYTLKYEDAEGNSTVVGNITIGEDDYINWLPISTDTDGSIYNGVGYKANVRLSASSGYTEKPMDIGDPLYLTGYIPVKTGDVLRFYNMTISAAADENYTGRLYVYDTSKTGVETNSAVYYASVSGWNVVSVDGNVTEITYGGADGFIRINADHVDENSIITINEEIV